MTVYGNVAVLLAAAIYLSLLGVSSGQAGWAVQEGSSSDGIAASIDLFNLTDGTLVTTVMTLNCRTCNSPSAALGHTASDSKRDAPWRQPGQIWPDLTQPDYEGISSGALPHSAPFHGYDKQWVFIHPNGTILGSNKDVQGALSTEEYENGRQVAPTVSLGTQLFSVEQIYAPSTAAPTVNTEGLKRVAFRHVGMGAIDTETDHSATSISDEIMASPQISNSANRYQYGNGAVSVATVKTSFGHNGYVVLWEKMDMGTQPQAMLTLANETVTTKCKFETTIVSDSGYYERTVVGTLYNQTVVVGRNVTTYNVTNEIGFNATCGCIYNETYATLNPSNCSMYMPYTDFNTTYNVTQCTVELQNITMINSTVELLNVTMVNSTTNSTYFYIFNSTTNVTWFDVFNSSTCTNESLVNTTRIESPMYDPGVNCSLYETTIVEVFHNNITAVMDLPNQTWNVTERDVQLSNQTTCSESGIDDEMHLSEGCGMGGEPLDTYPCQNGNGRNDGWRSFENSFRVVSICGDYVYAVGRVLDYYGSRYGGVDTYRMALVQYQITQSTENIVSTYYNWTSFETYTETETFASMKLSQTWPSLRTAKAVWATIIPTNTTYENNTNTRNPLYHLFDFDATNVNIDDMVCDSGSASTGAWIFGSFGGGSSGGPAPTGLGSSKVFTSSEHDLFAMHISTTAATDTFEMGYYSPSVDTSTTTSTTSLADSDAYISFLPIATARSWFAEFGTTSNEEYASRSSKSTFRVNSIYNSRIWGVATTSGDVDGDLPGRYNGLKDILVYTMVAATGTDVQMIQFGSKQDEFPTALLLDANGIYIAGMAQYNVDSNQRIYNGGVDMFVSKYPWCPDGSEMFSEDLECQECPVGRYLPAGTILGRCQFCAAGSHQNVTGQTSCNLCASNTYASSIGSVDCTTCPSGFSTTSTGSTSCAECSLGQYGDGITCRDCPVNTYQDEGAQTSCKECPNGSSSAEGSLNLNFCSCLTTQYGAPLVNGTGMVPCTDCPPNTICDSTMTSPEAKPGFYMFADLSSAVECVPPEACPGGDAETCAEGYIGQSCRDCQKGYYREAGMCLVCPLVNVNPIVFIIASVLLLLGISFMLCFMWCITCFCKKRVKRFMVFMRNSSGVVRMAGMQVAFLQVLLSIGALGLQIPTLVDFNVELKEFILPKLQSINIDISLDFLDTGFTKAECASSSFNFGHKYSATLLIPVILICLGTVASCILSVGCIPLCKFLDARKVREGRLSKKRSVCYHVFAFNKGWWTHLIPTINVWFFFLHTLTLEPYRCLALDGEYVLFADYSVKCYDLSDPSWKWMMPASVVTFFVFSFAFPAFALVGIVMHKFFPRVRSDPLVAWLWGKYETQFFYWEFVVIMRKFLLGVAMLLTLLGSTEQAFTMFSVNLFFMTLSIFNGPFLSIHDDALETISMLVLLMALVSAIAIDAQLSDTISETMIGVTVVIIILVQGVVALALICHRAKLDMCAKRRRMNRKAIFVDAPEEDVSVPILLNQPRAEQHLSAYFDTNLLETGPTFHRVALRFRMSHGLVHRKAERLFNSVRSFNWQKDHSENRRDKPKPSTNTAHELMNDLLWSIAGWMKLDFGCVDLLEFSVQEHQHGHAFPAFDIILGVHGVPLDAKGALNEQGIVGEASIIAKIWRAEYVASKYLVEIENNYDLVACKLLHNPLYTYDRVNVQGHIRSKIGTILEVGDQDDVESLEKGTMVDFMKHKGPREELRRKVNLAMIAALGGDEDSMRMHKLEVVKDHDPEEILRFTMELPKVASWKLEVMAASEGALEVSHEGKTWYLSKPVAMSDVKIFMAVDTPELPPMVLGAPRLDAAVGESGAKLNDDEKVEEEGLVVTTRSRIASGTSDPATSSAKEEVEGKTPVDDDPKKSGNDGSRMSADKKESSAEVPDTPSDGKAETGDGPAGAKRELIGNEGKENDGADAGEISKAATDHGSEKPEAPKAESAAPKEEPKSQSEYKPQKKEKVVIREEDIIPEIQPQMFKRAQKKK